MATLGALSTYLPDEAKAWKKVKGWGAIPGLTPRGFLFLQKMAAWRERDASTHNLARRYVMRDERLCDLVLAFQKDAGSVAASFQDGPLKNQVMHSGAEVEATAMHDLPRLPTLPPEGEKDRKLTSALTQLLREAATKAALAQRLIGTRDDVERLIRLWHKDPSLVSESCLLQGWRYDVFGKAALELLDKGAS
jgi:ribonuclease D